MLQVRYRNATLIIDERMQIYYGLHPKGVSRELADVMRIMMKSKIHRASVTQADLDYVGSVTLDAALMEAADLLEGEQVDLRGDRCPARPGLQITPPRSTAPARLPMATTICGGVQIHPVVAGSTGSN